MDPVESPLAESLALGLAGEKEDFEASTIRQEAGSSSTVQGAASPAPASGLRRTTGPSDFELLKVIGMGAFGKVLQVRSRQNGGIYAMKCISKLMLKKRNHVSYMQAERDIMTKVNHPFIVGLQCSFQTDRKLFLVMDYLPGGELFFHLNKQGLLLEDYARFYAAEMVLALEHLHHRGIIHRDLKPENLLLDADGHMCLTDFGLAKELTVEEDEGLKTICGTNEYMAPEMILRKGYGKAVDWWSMGALMYEMTAGYPPFKGKDLKELNRKILSEKVALPKWLSPGTHQVLRGFLQRNVSRRLGATKTTMFEIGGITAVKTHVFFESVDWNKLLAKQVKPPLVPDLAGDSDTSNFCDEFVQMALPRSLSEDSLMSHLGDPEAAGLYNGFSFVADGFASGDEEGGVGHGPQPGAPTFQPVYQGGFFMPATPGDGSKGGTGDTRGSPGESGETPVRRDKSKKGKRIRKKKVAIQVVADAVEGQGKGPASGGQANDSLASAEPGALQIDKVDIGNAAAAVEAARGGGGVSGPSQLALMLAKQESEKSLDNSVADAALAPSARSADADPHFVTVPSAAPNVWGVQPAPRPAPVPVPSPRPTFVSISPANPQAPSLAPTAGTGTHHVSAPSGPVSGSGSTWAQMLKSSGTITTSSAQAASAARAPRPVAAVSVRVPLTPAVTATARGAKVPTVSPERDDDDGWATVATGRSRRGARRGGKS